MDSRRILATAFIIISVLGMYFAGVAAAQPQSPIGPSLTIYELDQNGIIVPAPLNVFSAGQEIWIGVPSGRSPPYQLLASKLNGLPIAIQQGDSFPSDNMIPVSLSPGLFTPNHSYQLLLKMLVQTSPGFSTNQTSTTNFSIIPGKAHLALRSFSQQKSASRAELSLLDDNNNPSTGVHLALILHQGNSTLQVTTETTNLQGHSSFQIGESLAAGRYQLEIKVLDQDAVSSQPLQLPEFQVDTKPTILKTATTTDGQINTALLTADTQEPVPGRLLVLEKQLNDGNWTITSTAYTDTAGKAYFSSIPSGSWRLSFKGDTFYGPSTAESSVATSTSTTTPALTTLSTSQALAFGLALGGCVCACPTGPSPMGTPSPTCGGGGGGITPVSTSTTLYLPSSAYATIPIVLAALVKDVSNNPVTSQAVQFYNGTTTSNLIGTGTTNSTGYASVIWTVGATGARTIMAVYSGDAYHYSSTTQGSLTINQTPTITQILKLQPIAFSWDLYNYYSGLGFPIVIPVTILALARTNGSSTNIYTPSYTGASTTPPPTPGYGWAGLNLTSTVTLTFNGTFTEIQNMNWTRNFYLPPCPTPPSCLTSPRTGHMYLIASLSPPSTLYTSSSTSLNIPYQNVNSLSSALGQVTQSATPPKHIYVHVNATYPYLTVQMQSLPVALAAYVSYLAYSLQQNPSGTVQCSGSTCFNVYSLPVLSSTQGTDFAYACLNTSCTSVAANTQLNLYNINGKYCVTTTTDYNGVAHLRVPGSNNCTYPYYSLHTTSTQVVVSGLYAIEAISSPFPFYTNFQGYNYAVYPPQRTGSYLVHMHTYFQSSPYTLLYPSTSYPDVAYPYLSCCDIFLTVEKHPTNASVLITPGTPPTIATVRDNVKAALHLTDLASHKPLGNIAFSYNLTKNNPTPSVVALGSLTTNVNGTATLTLGQLSYGSYTLIATWPGNATTNLINTSVTFIVYKTRPTLVLRNVQEPGISYIHPSGLGSGNPPTLDASTQAYCSNTTTSCSATISTTHGNDIIIVYTVERRDPLSLGTCTFSISDTYQLAWKTRTGPITDSLDDAIQEYWAQASGPLTDTITESISGCASVYGGESNGLIAFGISGANYDSPFDPSSGTPGVASGYGGGTSATISTTNANDIVFSAVLHGNPTPPWPQPGFIPITIAGSFSTASEYAIATGTLTNVAVSFSDPATDFWEQIADAVQPAIMPSILPATGSPYRFYAYVGDDRPLQSSNWSCNFSPGYKNCVILQAFVGQTPATATTRWFLQYWAGNPGSYGANGSTCNFTSCAPTWSIAPSSLCNGAPYCYYFAVDLCCFSSIPNQFIRFSVNAFDIAGQSPIFGSYSTGWGFVDNPYGSFLVNGNTVRPSDLVNATSNTETFQFDATPFPNLITSVSIVVTNMTTGTSQTICLIGLFPCLQPAQMTTQSELLYPKTSLIFSNGAYNVTGYFTCSSCGNTQYRLMSIMLQFGRAGELASTQSAWIQGATALNPYYFRTFLADNATQSLITVSGLAENVYINDTLYASLSTNAGGNVFFPWTPAISAVYKIVVRFPEQSYYTSSNFTTLISVQLRGLILAVSSSPPNPEVSTSVSWSVLAEDMVTKAPVSSISVTQYVDGNVGPTTATDSSGNAIFSYNFTRIGPHNVTFASQSNQVFNSARNFNPLTVFLTTKLTLNGGTITVGQQNSLSLTLTDSKGSPLPAPGRQVTIQINGVFYQNVNTDANGNAQFNWQPDTTGTFTISANFYAQDPNDVGYRSSASTLKVTVIPQPVVNAQSTGSGTQSITFTTASAVAQAAASSGFSISVKFPSLGWVSVNIQLLGQSFQGTLHVWNEFGANCVAQLWGACVLAVPYWRVHFDVSINIEAAAFSLVTDFFTGEVRSAISTLAGTPVPFDPNSDAFTWGQNAGNAAYTASVFTYFAIMLGSATLGEPAAAPAAVAILLAFALATGIAAFLAFRDKASKENFLAGELFAVGLGILGKYVDLPQQACDWPCIPLVDWGWVSYWAIVQVSTPWGRIVLLTGMITLILGVLTALLMIAIMP